MLVLKSETLEKGSSVVDFDFLTSHRSYWTVLETNEKTTKLINPDMFDGMGCNDEVETSKIEPYGKWNI